MEGYNSKQLYETYLDFTSRTIPSTQMAGVAETCPIYIFKSEEEVKLWDRLYKQLGENHVEFCKRLHEELRESHAEWLKNNLSATELGQFDLGE